MEKLKYKLTNNTINYQGHTLYRIIALKDFGDIKAGDFGGFVESGHNLSQSGNCWIFEGAKVYKEAEVFGNARILGVAQISDYAQIYGNTQIYGNAQIFGDARIEGNIRISGNTKILGQTTIKNLEDISIEISRSNQILNIGVLGSRNDCTTFFYSNNQIYVCCGCFTDTLNEFLLKVSKTHKGNVHFTNYISAAKFAKEYLERNNK